MASDGEDDAQSYESYYTDDGDDYTDEVDSNVDDDGESWDLEEGEVDDDDDDEAKKKKAAAAVDLTKIDRRYRNLSEEQVRARQDADTANVGELFAIPPGFAAVLLRHYKWSLVELQDRLFSDGDRAGAATGVALGGAPVSRNGHPLVCAICFDEHLAGEMRSAGCSHFYCVGCWRGYVHAAVGDGARCLSFRCPDPACSAAVVRELVDEVAGDAVKARYATFLLRSYVEEGTRIKWCPGPGCTLAIEFVGGGGGEEKQDDVECRYGHGFCFRCGEEAHRPVSCDTVRAWTEKNAMDDHRSSEYYNCNVYDAAKANGEASDDKRRREQGMASLDRYMHFYERWAAHGKARQSAVDDMAGLDACAEKLSAAVAMPVTELCFLAEAYQQIAECRRLLRWTYAYGYYHLGTGLDGDEERRTMVECAQGEAERQLEKLHDCAEHEREELLAEVERTIKLNAILKDNDGEESKKKMEEKAGEMVDMVVAYRQKLAGLTGVCKIFFRNLVKTFQDGLSEVGPAVAAAAAAAVATAPAESSDDAEEDIAKVCEVLSLSPGAAAVLLRLYRWRAVLLQEEWFLDERRIRDAAGLLPADGGGGAVPARVSRRRLTCAICFDVFAAGGMRSAGCSHYYCVACWRGYVRAAVGDGARCLSLRCPDPSCPAAVVRELVDAVADGEDRERYGWFALRSYVEESAGMRWCPGPGCSRAVEFVGGGGDGEESSEVFCSCGHGLCWRCGEEAHRPVSCKTVAKWVEKNSSESETATWLLAHTKHCPKCRLPIEKNLGCMHMTCRPPCLHEFCWICLKPWRGHAACSRYQPNGTVVALAGANADDERRRQAKASLDRYLYHYERWDANLKSLRVALRDMESLERSELEAMASAAGVPATEMGFVTEAYEQVGEGRRVLGWAHAYGYYLDPDRDFTKRQLFEYLQEDANASLERLHGCAERERRELFATGADDKAAVDFDKYRAYREKLAGLTRVTRQYFGNLVKAFETDLAEVSSSS
uniref:RBR-type E3 ubiquitin transferase n=1 Tax=Oryza glumipatula TaxID=40148 RepID=A0A0E0B6I8_9ORYZ